MMFRMTRIQIYSISLGSGVKIENCCYLILTAFFHIVTSEKEMCLKH